MSHENELYSLRYIYEDSPDVVLQAVEELEDGMSLRISVRIGPHEVHMDLQLLGKTSIFDETVLEAATAIPQR